MSEDPVLFALTDHIGQIIVACCGGYPLARILSLNQLVKE